MKRSDLRTFLLEELSNKGNTEDSKWLEGVLESLPIDSYVILDFLDKLIHRQKYKEYFTPDLDGCVTFYKESKWDYFKSRILHCFNEDNLTRAAVVKKLSKKHLAPEKLIQSGIQELIDEGEIEYKRKDRKTLEEREAFYETVRHLYEECPDMTMQDIADKFGKSNSYVRFLIHDLRKKGIITTYRHIKIAYTCEEDTFIISKRFLRWSYDDISDKLGRTAQSVKQRFYYLYYNRPEFYNTCTIEAVSKHNNMEDERMSSYA